jgi:hypothetical protein
MRWRTSASDVRKWMFGSNRLVDTREGPNIRQSFDGVRVWTTRGDARVDAFWTRPLLDKEGWFDDTSERAQQFFLVFIPRRLWL